jgi:hypothetical protein
MNTKLTLSVDKAVIEKAKLYAAKENRSLSELIESYLKVLVVSEPEVLYSKTSPKMETPITESLIGVIKVNDDFDYKTELTEELSKKYLK